MCCTAGNLSGFDLNESSACSAIRKQTKGCQLTLVVPSGQRRPGRRPCEARQYPSLRSVQANFVQGLQLQLLCHLNWLSAPCTAQHLIWIWVRIYFGMCFFVFFLGCFSFFVRARKKMSYFTAFSREIEAFYTSPSTSPASFSTSPACPSNIPSITNKSWVTKSQK